MAVTAWVEGNSLWKRAGLGKGVEWEGCSDRLGTEQECGAVEQGVGVSIGRGRGVVEKG